jgi:predicted O-methyltransferase YrrM
MAMTIARDVLRFPRRTWRSLCRHMRPVYRHQRAADRFALQHLSAPLRQRLEAVPGNSSARECRLLFYLAATAPGDGCLVEIGAFKGKSTAWLAQAARMTGRRLVSIDPHMGPTAETFAQTVRDFAITEVATLHQAYSHDIGRTWAEPISFLWVDGGHDYETVLQDIHDFAPHVQPGGTVVFDDAGGEVFPGVLRAIREAMMRDPCYAYLGSIKQFALFRRRMR